MLLSVRISAGSCSFHICIVLGRKLFLANDVLNTLVSLIPPVVDSRVSLVKFWDILRNIYLGFVLDFALNSSNRL